MKTQIENARANHKQKITRHFIKFREMLLALGGVHVSVWALFSCNFFFGLYLIIARETLFGSPIRGVFPYPFIEHFWSILTNSADVILLCLALMILIGLRFKIPNLVYSAALISSSIWAGVWALSVSAYFMNLTDLPSIVLTGIIPIGFSVFSALRVAADDSELRPKKH